MENAALFIIIIISKMIKTIYKYVYVFKITISLMEYIHYFKAISDCFSCYIVSSFSLKGYIQGYTRLYKAIHSDHKGPLST